MLFPPGCGLKCAGPLKYQRLGAMRGSYLSILHANHLLGGSILRGGGVVREVPVMLTLEVSLEELMLAFFFEFLLACGDSFLAERDNRNCIKLSSWWCSL